MYTVHQSFTIAIIEKDGKQSKTYFKLFKGKNTCENKTLYVSRLISYDRKEFEIV